MIEVTLTVTADTTTTLGGLLDDLQLLQGLQDLAGDGAGADGVVGGAGAAALAATVHLLEGTDTGTGTDVQVTSNRG